MGRRSASHFGVARRGQLDCGLLIAPAHQEVDLALEQVGRASEDGVDGRDPPPFVIANGGHGDPEYFGQFSHGQLRLLGVGTPAICQLELGRCVGTVATWDKLEDALSVNQRLLRRLGSPDGEEPEA